MVSFNEIYKQNITFCEKVIFSYYMPLALIEQLHFDVLKIQAWETYLFFLNMKKGQDG